MYRPSEQHGLGWPFIRPRQGWLCWLPAAGESLELPQSPLWLSAEETSPELRERRNRLPFVACSAGGVGIPTSRPGPQPGGLQPRRRSGALLGWRCRAGAVGAPSRAGSAWGAEGSAAPCVRCGLRLSPRQLPQVLRVTVPSRNGEMRLLKQRCTLDVSEEEEVCRRRCQQQQQPQGSGPAAQQQQQPQGCSPQRAATTGKRQLRRAQALPEQPPPVRSHVRKSLILG